MCSCPALGKVSPECWSLGLCPFQVRAHRVTRALPYFHPLQRGAAGDSEALQKERSPRARALHPPCVSRVGQSGGAVVSTHTCRPAGCLFLSLRGLEAQKPDAGCWRGPLSLVPTSRSSFFLSVQAGRPLGQVISLCLISGLLLFSGTLFPLNFTWEIQFSGLRWTVPPPQVSSDPQSETQALHTFLFLPQRP